MILYLLQMIVLQSQEHMKIMIHQYQSARKGEACQLWKNLAKQDKRFGHLEVFCENLPDQSWFVSTTTVTDKRIAEYIEKN